MPSSRLSRRRSSRPLAGAVIVALGSALFVAGPGLTASASAAPASVHAAPARLAGSPVQAAPLTVAAASQTALQPSLRSSVAAAYLNVLAPALDVPVNWTGGSASSCAPGAPSASAQNATLTAVNFFRNLAGLPSVTLNASLSAQAQQAALMMDAQNALSHTPSSNWSCYTATGASAAGKSDLYLGVTGPASVAGYMIDPGASNGDAGHRRWILYPPQTTMGSGSTSEANALYVVDETTWHKPASTPQYVAWPPAGYLPGQLEPGGRWSLSATDESVSFAGATVTVTKNGARLPVTVNPVEPGAGLLVGDPTLVWQIAPGYSLGQPDQAYQVTVSGMKRDGAALPAYSYTTTLFDPTYVAAQSITFANPGTHAYGDTFVSSARASSGLAVTTTSLTPSICWMSGTTVTVSAPGTCTLQASQAGNPQWHAAAAVQQSFTVTKRAVTVAAVSRTVPPGSVPALTTTYTGLAFGQTLAAVQANRSLTGAPSCTTTATNSSPSGSYPITCTAGTLSSGYYTFSFAAGTLKITLGEVPVDPYRLVDTRTKGGAVASHGQVSLSVVGIGGVPVGASAVVLNVTATQPKSSGVVTVYPSGKARPTSSNLNFVKGQTVPNSVIAPVGSDGKVILFNNSVGSVQLVVDVSGYFVTAATPKPGQFSPVTPARLLDTRSSLGAVAAHHSITVQVTGRAGIPANASAVALNITATQGKSSGVVTAFGYGTAMPSASNLNFVKGQTVPNLVVTPIGSGGKVVLYNNSVGSVQLVADVMGYFVAGGPTTAGTFGALHPTRVVDTRTGTKRPVGAGQSLSVAIAGRDGVPAGATAVVLNVTATQPTAAGVVTVYASGRPRPTASNLNFVRNQTVPNLVIAPVGANGQVMLFNNTKGTVHLVVDVSGYFIG